MRKKKEFQNRDPKKPVEPVASHTDKQDSFLKKLFELIGHNNKKTFVGAKVMLSSMVVALMLSVCLTTTGTVELRKVDRIIKKKEYLGILQLYLKSESRPLVFGYNQLFYQSSDAD
ncbi:hypothetical protein ILYODFUR_029632 [Ilyodon furcidens]|uniref:Uncharacterized protein n=1 Tax=Ilyodon furcidens TaxID=33524 RepID=A0ABV0VIA7_9TELE